LWSDNSKFYEGGKIRINRIFISNLFNGTSYNNTEVDTGDAMMNHNLNLQK